MHPKSILFGIPLLFYPCDVQAGDPPNPKRPHYSVPAGDSLIDRRLADELVSPEAKTPEDKERARVAREVARCVLLNGSDVHDPSSKLYMKQRGTVEYAYWFFDDDRYRYWWHAYNAENDVFTFGDDGHENYDALYLTMCVLNDLRSECVEDSDGTITYINFLGKDKYESPLDGIRTPQVIYDEALKRTLEHCTPKIS